MHPRPIRRRLRRAVELAGAGAIFAVMWFIPFHDPRDEGPDWAASAHESPSSFHGYDCTDDCSGHQAGWDWAERNGLSAKAQCSGNSQSFIEGCWAYVER